MQRRDFLKSVAAAFATSATGSLLLPTPAPVIRTDLFCDTVVDGRYYLSEPFHQGGLAACTDARILVSWPDEREHGNGDRRLPNVSKLWWDQFDALNGWQPLSSARAGDKPCKWVAGCERCLGTGFIGSDVHRAVDMDGDFVWAGKTQCPDCVGDGMIFNAPAMVFQGREFNPSYVARLKTIGDLDCRVIQTVGDDRDKCGVLMFRGNNIRGFLMGLASE